ncbi:Os06g0731950, partial [Oryza sativa Japonica Group]
QSFLNLLKASVPDGEISRNFSCIKIGGLFLRDTFSPPPCTLTQPSMQSVPQEPPPVSDFGQNFCPQIYPFENQLLRFTSGTPFMFPLLSSAHSFPITSKVCLKNYHHM